MKLSVIIPGIRPQNWLNLYDSIKKSFSEDFEAIFVGPHYFVKLGDKTIGNVPGTKFIKSYRSPCAAQQQGLMKATGDYITWAADDGIFLPHALDEAMNMINFATSEDEGEFVVVGRYLEGDSPIGMHSQDYYRFRYHKPYRLAGINPDWLIFNCGLISRKLILELGGWDCQFETTTCAHADLGIRVQKSGARMLLMDDVMFKCSHQPGKTGDHAPVHRAMVKRDLPRFQEMYRKPNERIKIELDNWKVTPEIWSERFK